MKLSDIQYLRQYSNFCETTASFIRYQRDPIASQKLLETYSLSEIAGDNDDFTRAFRLTQWLCAHVRHDGSYGNNDPQDAWSLLSLFYEKDHVGINCLSLSIILAECCLALSIPARVVYMMPYSFQDIDNHVVVEIYCNRNEQWILLDPTYSCYISDQKGTPLSLMQVRNLLEQGHPFFFSDTFSYNGEPVLDVEDVRQYYAKNLFFLRCRSLQRFGSHVHQENMIEIAPRGFDVHTRMVKNLEYRIAQFGPFPVLKTWLCYESQLKNQTLSPFHFYQPAIVE